MLRNEQISSLVPEPMEIGSATISRLNSQGERKKMKQLDIIDSCREALNQMPDGKTGVVLGSGQNTEGWKQRGWKTLDIDPADNPDIVYDANHMDQVVAPESLDFIFAEAVRMDVKGREGVSPARLLQQANETLKMGGKIIIKTAHFENIKSELPIRQEYVKLLQAHGFHGVAELGPIIWIDKEQGKYNQQVIYYGEKQQQGFRLNTEIQ